MDVVAIIIILFSLLVKLVDSKEKDKKKKAINSKSYPNPQKMPKQINEEELPNEAYSPFKELFDNLNKEMENKKQSVKQIFETEAQESDAQSIKDKSYEGKQAPRKNLGKHAQSIEGKSYEGQSLDTSRSSEGYSLDKDVEDRKLKSAYVSRIVNMLEEKENKMTKESIINAQEMKNAIIWSEILAKPKALQKKVQP